MKNFICVLIVVSIISSTATAQNIGIGTSTPTKKLSVNGSILIDQNNTNAASIDSAALRFGTSTAVGISSNRDATKSNLNGLDLWTSGNRTVSVTATGRVGINTPDPQFQLDVNGTINSNYLYSNGIRSGGSIFTDFDLNADDDLSVGDDATIMGNVGIGISPNTTDALRIAGTVNIDGKITNEGKGIVKSNSGTTLRQGFTSGAFTVALNANTGVNVDFCITKFTGDNDNVRVIIGQFIPGAGASSTAGNAHFTVTQTYQGNGVSTAPCGGGSYARIRISNPTASTIDLGDNATLYLFNVVTD